jgi:amino acid transporter
MKWTPKDCIILILVLGIVTVLGILTMNMHTATDVEHANEVVTIIKMTVTGLVGIVAGFIGGKNSSD